MADSVTYDRKTIWFITVSVGLWWAANSITAITSKSFMRDKEESQTDAWSLAFVDFRWLELTTLQHLIGAVVSVIWLKVFLRKPVWPFEASKKIIFLAALGNILGNMATNAAYTLVSSSMTQVVKACEPLFTFALSLFLYRDYTVLNATTLLSILIMITGASLFVAFDSTFIVSGLLAALCSNVGFPIRNIYLKRLSNVWQSSFQKYAVISLYSTFLLAPVVLVKCVFIGSLALMNNLQDGLISSSFHCTYNLASIYVLQNFPPLTHAILNLLKRGIVIVINLVYFQLPLSWKMIIGLIALLVGLYIYLSRNLRSTNSFRRNAVLGVVVIILLSLCFVLTRTTSSVVTTLQKNNIHHFFHSVETKSSQRIDTKEDIFREKEIAPSISIRTAWVFDRPIPKNILSNLQVLSNSCHIHVYCGTSHCIQAVQELSNADITIEFLLIGELLKGNPLDEWLAHHSFYKVLALKSYEDHLQEAVRLGILWKYGGVYIEPNIQFLGRLNTSIFSCPSRAWVGQPSRIKDIQHFKLACFPRFSQYIEKLSSMLAKEYYKPSSVRPTFDVKKEAWEYLFSESQLPEVLEIAFDTLSTETDRPWNHHYGTLSFDTRVHDTPFEANIGDEVQGYPGLQFLPFMDNFVERDNLGENKNTDQNILVFFNAWWGSKFTRLWPPSPNIEPILVSIHIANDMKPVWQRNDSLSYFKPRAPIGCRDFTTLDFLSKLNVSAYFSGCFTLMQLSPYVRTERTSEIVVVDVGKKFFEMLPQKIKVKATRVSHSLYGDAMFKKISRLTEAFNRIELYSRAKLVITQRIHTALPCVAMGTPVIFINSVYMPGGVGSAKASSPRTVGLTSMFHTLDLYKISENQAQKWLANFPWDNPPPNPNMAIMMRLRASFWYVVRQKSSLYDASRKFGVIPMLPPSPCTSHVLFHVHFTSPDDQFTWQDHRSIESIFHHHACAVVHIYSNTLKEDRLDLFKESGYIAKIVRYKIIALLKDTPLEIYLPRIVDHTSASNEKYLLRGLVVYREGGIYVDSNIILTKPVSNLTSDLLVWGDSSKEQVDTSFMRFLKGSKYLESVLTKFATESVAIDNDLYTQVLQELKGQPGFSVVVHDYDTVFVFDTMQVDKLCYEHISRSSYASIKQSIQEKAIAVALSRNYSITKTIGTGTTPLKLETICRDLLHDFCVVCSNLL